MKRSITALVFCGGMAGAIARFEIGVGAAAAGASSPLFGLLVANVIGAALLGFLHGRFHLSVASVDGDIADPRGRGARRLWIVPLLGAGFCGTMTTFSHLAVEMMVMVAAGAAVVAAGWSIVWLVAGVAAASLGVAMGHRPVPASN